jgi:hypothetical protein
MPSTARFFSPSQPRRTNMRSSPGEHLLSVRGAGAQKAYRPTLVYSHVRGD